MQSISHLKNWECMILLHIAGAQSICTASRSIGIACASNSYVISYPQLRGNGSHWIIMTMVMTSNAPFVLFFFQAIPADTTTVGYLSIQPVAKSRFGKSLLLICRFLLLHSQESVCREVFLPSFTQRRIGCFQPATTKMSNQAPDPRDSQIPANDPLKPRWLLDIQEWKIVLYTDVASQVEPPNGEYGIVSYTWGYISNLEAPATGTPADILWDVPTTTVWTLETAKGAMEKIGSRYIWWDWMCVPQEVLNGTKPITPLMRQVQAEEIAKQV
jgi:hypothetical protein